MSSVYVEKVSNSLGSNGIFMCDFSRVIVNCLNLNDMGVFFFNRIGFVC